MKVIETKTLGEAWISTMKTIIENGKDCIYTDNVTEEFNVREFCGLNLSISEPCWPDSIINDYMNLEEFNWMKDNFLVEGEVKELHNEDSYATRLYKYMGNKNQVEWVIKRLKQESRLRSATITTFQPLKDDKYIPCVSLIDFNVEDNKLVLYVYCRALDFGTKAYANLAMLYLLQKQVADGLNMETGKLELVAKSVHLYDRNMERVNEIIKNF